MPTDYKSDLHEIDRETLEKSDRSLEWLWLIRDNGTALLPLRLGQHPVAIVGWMTVPAQVYHLHDGKVEQVTFNQAKKLANLPAPPGAKLWHSAGLGWEYVRDGKVLGWVRNDGMSSTQVYTSLGTHHATLDEARLEVEGRFA
jgi:hypothetical protein